MIIIFDQSKSCAYNWDNTVCIYVYNNHLTIEDMIRNCSTLADYSSKEIACEALEMVISAISSGFPTIYMPYEDKVREHLNNKQNTKNSWGGAKHPLQRQNRRQEGRAK